MVSLMAEDGLVIGPSCNPDAGEWPCCRSSL